MDKKRDDMVSLDEFKEFFNKLSTSDFASLTEFLFQIFDTNGNTQFIILVEVSYFSTRILLTMWVEFLYNPEVICFSDHTLRGRSQTTFTRQGGCPNVNKCQQGAGRWSVLCQRWHFFISFQYCNYSKYENNQKSKKNNECFAYIV